MKMKTERIDRKAFNVVSRTIRANLRFGGSSLRCEVQTGHCPSGKFYRTRPSWWIKFDNSPTFSGPWTKEAIRAHFVRRWEAVPAEESKYFRGPLPV